MRAILMLLLASLGACDAGQKPPDGYIKACYGGDWSKHMVGKTPSYSVVLNIEEKEWPQLKTLLKTYAQREGLEHFDMSQETKGLSMVSISACSQDGLWIHADKRVWRIEGEAAHSPLPLMVTAIMYSNPDRWRETPKRLDRALRAVWPGKIDSAHGIESSLQSSPL